MKYIAILTMFVIAACGFQKSEGYKVGQLSSLTHSGIIFTTAEVKLNLIGEVINFSIRSEDESRLLPIVQEAVESGKRVKVHFTRNLYIVNTAGETECFINNIEYDEAKK